MSKPTDSVTCGKCGKTLSSRNFYNNDSEIYRHNNGCINVCKDCIGELYEYYYRLYDSENQKDKDKVRKKAVERICMMFNYYYSDKIFTNTINGRNAASNLMSAYIRQTRLVQYKEKSYDTTLQERMSHNQNAGITTVSEDDIETKPVPPEVIQRFGSGFENSDYVYLQEQYEDWTTRHECKTKVQEEIFKRLCFKQLEIHKATIAGADTKDLDKTFQQLLDTAKLQPKQNRSDVLSDAQCLGTLIDKWENTKPIPEPAPEWQDVDNIALTDDVFYRGHLAKSLGIKGGYSKLYDDYMKQFTVDKPQYNGEEDTDVIFDAVFGKSEKSD